MRLPIKLDTLTVLYNYFSLNIVLGIQSVLAPNFLTLNIHQALNTLLSIERSFE